MGNWEDDSSNDGEITADENAEIQRLTTIAEAEGKTVYGASVHKVTREITILTDLDDPMMSNHPDRRMGDLGDLLDLLGGLVGGLDDKCKECDKTDCPKHPDYKGKDDDDLKSPDLGSHVGPKHWS